MVAEHHECELRPVDRGAVRPRGCDREFRLSRRERASPRPALAIDLIGEVHLSADNNSRIHAAMEHSVQLTGESIEPSAGHRQSSDHRSPRVTVAIVTYRSKAELPGCIESILRSDISIKIVVIDNDSRDGTYELARSYADSHRNITALATDRNIGLAAANNLVIPHIEGTHVLILNPDTVLEPDAISTMMSLMDERPDVGVVGPMNVY